MGLKKGIIYILSANILSLLMNLITNLVLPKYLSVEIYATIKTFQLYISYIGVLSLGYVDGLYLEYGGKNMSTLSKQEAQIGTSTLRLSQAIFGIMLFVFGMYNQDYICLAISLVIVPLNMTGYFKSLYQAMGEFGRYAKFTNFSAIFMFLGNLFLLFIIKERSTALPYLITYISVNCLVWLCLEYEFSVTHDKGISVFRFSIDDFRKNVRSGISLMLGNFSSIILTSMDRLFVQYFLKAIHFAHYSFAVSMEGFLNVAISPLTITLYNYFCMNKKREDIIKIRGPIIIFAAFLISSAFPAKFVLEVYLQKYMDSSVVMFYLFAAQVFYVLIKAFYVNLYKAREMQKTYFIKLISVIAVGFVLNIALYSLNRKMESFAVGTLLSALYWLAIVQIDFKDLRLSINEIFYILLTVTVFLLCGIFLNAVLGFILYSLIVIMLSFITMKDGAKYLIRFIVKK